MKSRLLIVLFFLAVFSCKKDEPSIAAHQELTRIDYEINSPFEMPNIAFEFEDTYNLSNHTVLTVDILANDQSGRLNLIVMLEDIDGHKNDGVPMIITEDEILFNNELETFSFDLNNHLESITSGTDQIQLDRIHRIIIYINSGVTGKITKGIFWLDKVVFTKPV